MKPEARFEEALQYADSYEQLKKLALEFAAEGKTPDGVLEIFESFRAQLRIADREREEDVIVDVMDCIVGWCSPNEKLFK